MKLIAISSPTLVPSENGIINSLFEQGLEIFHIHKPGLTVQEIKDFIQKIPAKHHSKIFFHSDFPKFHSLEELKEQKEKYDYAFLSPIFDSISKIGYRSNFDLQEVKETIKDKNIIALGGVDDSKIETCRELGFTGIAVLGALWDCKNPIEKFKKIKRLCDDERSEASVLDSSLRSE